MTIAQARTKGVSRREMESARYVRPMHGVIAPVEEVWSIKDWVRAARLVLPDDAQPVGLTWLQLRGVDFGPILPMHFATIKRFQTSRPQLSVVHRPGLATQPTDVRAALRSVFGDFSLKDAIALADRTVFRGVASPHEIASWAETARCEERSILRWVRPGAESIRETYLRLCVVLSGLPEPDTQVSIDDAGRFVGRFDMAFRDFRTLLEYDGDQHRTDKAQWDRDLDRGNLAQALGYEVVRVNAATLRDPWGVVELVHRHLMRAGYRGRKPTRRALWLSCFGR